VVVDTAGEVYGDAPNIAERVQALAESDAVPITARVQRQVAGLFVAKERGSHELKGVPEPLTLFRVLRASGGGGRSGVRRLTPFVGRDKEIAMLTQRWERAREGDGQLVQIIGEPGLGKSRLIAEFHARLRDTPHTWVEWSCSQLLQNTPLHPIAEWGRQRFGGADVPAEQRLADLENSLAQVKLDPAENLPLLAPLLNIPLAQERAPTLAPEELRRRQLAALSRWSIVSARIQPVMLAVEDLHWADPTTLDVLRGIAGLQHAGHFHNCSVGISNEAKGGHRKDEIKCCIAERQALCQSLDRMQLCALDFAPLSRGGDHCRICIECRYKRTKPGKFRCKRGIAAADVQEPLAGNWTSKFGEELLLQRIGNIAKTARSPSRVGSGQSFFPLGAAHETIRLATPASATARHCNSRPASLSRSSCVIHCHQICRRSFMTTATTVPEITERAPTAAIAKTGPKRSAMIPAESAPTAYPRSRRKP
jgi:hypothetical protein